MFFFKLVFPDLLLSSAFDVTIIRNLLILRISFKYEETQSIMQGMPFPKILINNNKHLHISVIYYPSVFKLKAV